MILEFPHQRLVVFKNKRGNGRIPEFLRRGTVDVRDRDFEILGGKGDPVSGPHKRKRLAGREDHLCTPRR